MPHITHLYRYPIKGLSAEPLQRVVLKAGETIPLDRHFAIAHGTTQFDVNAPQYLPKTHFLMLMRNEQLAALRTVYDEKQDTLTIWHQNEKVLHTTVRTREGQAAIEEFFAHYLGKSVRGKPQWLEATGHSFSDVAAKVISCVNLASVRELEAVVGIDVHPLRFRANLYFDGVPAWTELRWQDKELTLGTAKVRMLKPIERCAATNVDPQTAQRDLSIPHTLVQTYSHHYMGIYVQVIGEGEINVGDEFIEPRCE